MDKITTHLLRIRKGKVKLRVRHGGKKIIALCRTDVISVGQELGSEAEI